MSGLHPTRFDGVTGSLLAALEREGITDHQVEYARSFLLLEIGARVVDGDRMTDEAESINAYMEAYDAMFIGLLVREFMPRTDGEFGYRKDEDPTLAAFSATVSEAQASGMEPQALIAAGMEAYSILRAVSRPGTNSIEQEALLLCSIGVMVCAFGPTDEG